MRRAEARAIEDLERTVGLKQQRIHDQLVAEAAGRRRVASNLQIAIGHVDRAAPAEDLAVGDNVRTSIPARLEDADAGPGASEWRRKSDLAGSIKVEDPRANEIEHHSVGVGGNRGRAAR